MDRIKEFQITWRSWSLWVDVYKEFYRVTLPDGRELRLYRDREGAWRGQPSLNIIEELGQLIEEYEPLK